MGRRTTRRHARYACVLLSALALDTWCGAAAAQFSTARPRLDLGPPRDVAPGVRLHHLTDSGVLDLAMPISIWLLRIDPSAVALRPVLSNDEVMGTETVPSIAARHGAIAAINAGFFHPNGDPTGIYKLGGQLVSDTRRSRGAVGIIGRPRQRLIYDRLSAKIVLRVHPRGPGAPAAVDVAGIDTVRRLGRVMLYTPAYHEHTDTAPGGSEWVIDGHPLRVVSGPHAGGKTPIPQNGFVISYGGRSPPPPLRRLRRGTRIDLDTLYDVEHGRADEWKTADHIIGGAGLLAREGRLVDDWTVEDVAPGFTALRHPRTMIGTHADGSIWLVTVDGRQPQLSAGMTLGELRDLAARLGLRSALNLDGGGSTTMWVKGSVVNSPSDAAGARNVSDALLVVSR